MLEGRAGMAVIANTTAATTSPAGTKNLKLRSFARSIDLTGEYITLNSSVAINGLASVSSKSILAAKRMPRITGRKTNGPETIWQTIREDLCGHRAADRDGHRVKLWLAVARHGSGCGRL